MKNCSFVETQSSDRSRNDKKLVSHLHKTELYRCYSICAVAQPQLNGCHRVVCGSDTCAMCIYSVVFKELLKLPETLLQHANI